MVDFAFLDSGTGGIPYMILLKEKNPEAKCVYLGDTANFPYGEKSFKEITRCAANAVDLIIKKWNPRTIIIACNTISVTALESLRKEFPCCPIVGTVPAIKLAAKITKNNRIGFLATNASINHPYSQKLIKDFASGCKIFKRADPDLISFIEKNLFTATKEQKLNAVAPAVDFFCKNECDVIILGCTHFTHIADVIAEAAGKSVTVIDSREGVSNQAIKVEQQKIGAKNTENLSEKNPSLPLDCSFFVTSATINEQEEYKLLCQKLGIPWGGIVS